VDHASAQSHFSTAPSLTGSFAWSGNTMTFAPSGEGYQTTYNFGVAPGVVPAWGLPRAKWWSGSYLTQYQDIQMNVPAYKQAYPMSCELASLRMLLAYRGIFVTDYDILMRIGYNPRPRDKSTNTWDDPNQTYVGYLNGIPITNGYGVHSGPVAAAARSFGRQATSQWDVSAAWIAGQVYAGNPVEVWGHSAPDFLTSWNTDHGVVQAAPSQHARVVYGVVGSASNSVAFHIIDPWTGTKVYWSAGQLMANMNGALPVSNQSVVVW